MPSQVVENALSLCHYISPSLSLLLSISLTHPTHHPLAVLHTAFRFHDVETSSVRRRFFLSLSVSLCLSVSLSLCLSLSLSLCPSVSLSLSLCLCLSVIGLGHDSLESMVMRHPLDDYVMNDRNLHCLSKVEGVQYKFNVVLALITLELGLIHT